MRPCPFRQPRLRDPRTAPRIHTTPAPIFPTLPSTSHPAPPTMICHRCLLRTRTRTRARASQHSLRTLTTSAAKPAQAVSSTAAPTPAPRQGAPGSSHQPAPATSTSAAQPFSTPLTPSPAALGVAPPRKGAGVPVAALSSVPAGTPLRGLNFVKGKSDPVALEDAEYPAWLWGVLKAGAAEGKGEEGEGDLFCELRSFSSFRGAGGGGRGPASRKARGAWRPWQSARG